MKRQSTAQQDNDGLRMPVIINNLREPETNILHKQGMDNDAKPQPTKASTGSHCCKTTKKVVMQNFF